MNLTDLLARHDPAPARDLDADELDRRERLLTHILTQDRTANTGTGTERIGRSPHRGTRLLAAAAVVVVAALGAAALRLVPLQRPGGASPGPLGAAELAAWTSVPTRLGSAATLDSPAGRWCRQHLTGDPADHAEPTISNADTRGTVTSLVLTRGRDITLCLVGKDGHGIAEAIDPLTPLPPAGICTDSAGGFGSEENGFDYLVGNTGTSVTAVTLAVPGRPVHALVDHGRWTAWWPSPHPDGLINGSITLTLTDGSTRTLPSSTTTGCNR